MANLQERLRRLNANEIMVVSFITRQTKEQICWMFNLNQAKFQRVFDHACKVLGIDSSLGEEEKAIEAYRLYTLYEYPFKRPSLKPTIQPKQRERSGLSPLMDKYWRRKTNTRTKARQQIAASG